MKKRKIKKKNIIYLLIFIIICILILVLLKNIFTNKKIINNEYSIIGYNNSEIQKIELLSDNEKNIIKKNDYNKKLINIIENKNYLNSKLDLYLKYSIDYNDIDNMMLFVNEYLEKGIELNNTSLSFIKEKYFIGEYFDRYMKYYNNNQNLSLSEIITRINSNLDYPFYENSTPSDTSKGIYTLVNKYYYLDKNFIPDDIIIANAKYTLYNGKLNKTAYENFVKMADDAAKQGLTIKITTGYRDYNFQATLYNNYVQEDGKVNADTYSARPGYSEHQLGYSADLTNAQAAGFSAFKDTNEYTWLINNAYKYGFILRYPEGKEYITGYQFESWHYRYVGIDIATYIYNNNITYEEYYAYYLR